MVVHPLMSPTVVCMLDRHPEASLRYLLLVELLLTTIDIGELGILYTLPLVKAMLTLLSTEHIIGRTFDDSAKQVSI